MKRWMIALATAATVGAAGTMAAPTASATHGAGRTVSASDPDDVGSRLDIVREAFRLNGHRTATLRIRTAETWRCGLLQNFAENGEPYSAGLRWEFDRGADGTFGDINGGFDCQDGQLVFHLNHPGTFPDRTFQASRPTARSAVVSMPRRALHSQDLALQARSRFDGTKGDHVAFDEEDIAPTLRAF